MIFFNDHGILCQHSCTNTPQQNEIVERKCYHLLNVGCALRFQANMPYKIFGRKHTNNLLSHKSTAYTFVVSQVTYEILYQKPPIYSHIRVFDCLCYATSLTPMHKFDARAYQCIFFGYPLSQKRY